MRNEITTMELFELMYDIGVEPEDDDGEGGYYDGGPTLRTDYSGRGMYGDRCVGIVCGDTERIMFELGMAIGERVAYEDGVRWAELAESFKRASTDSMGRDAIVYFPSLTVAEEEEAA